MFCRNMSPGPRQNRFFTKANDPRRAAKMNPPEKAHFDKTCPGCSQEPIFVENAYDGTRTEKCETMLTAKSPGPPEGAPMCTKPPRAEHYKTPARINIMCFSVVINCRGLLRSLPFRQHLFMKFALYADLINRPQAAARSEITEDASKISIEKLNETWRENTR